MMPYSDDNEWRSRRNLTRDDEVLELKRCLRHAAESLRWRGAAEDGADLLDIMRCLDRWGGRL